MPHRKLIATSAVLALGSVLASPAPAQAATSSHAGSCTTSFTSPITGHETGAVFRGNVGVVTNKRVSGVAVQATSHARYKVGRVPFVFYFNKSATRAVTIVPGRTIRTNTVVRRLPGSSTLEQRQVRGRPTHVRVVWDAWTNYSGPRARNRKVSTMTCTVRLSSATRVPTPRPSPRVSPR